MPLARAQKERRNIRELGGKAKILTELCPTVLWKAELLSNEFVHLAEEISKQSGKNAAWFLLNTYVKCERKDRNSGKNY